jgi:hypothetical protein
VSEVVTLRVLAGLRGPDPDAAAAAFVFRGRTDRLEAESKPEFHSPVVFVFTKMVKHSVRKAP